jgi:hypothetical protein
MKKCLRYLVLVTVLLYTDSAYTWGFFAHKLINRLAVFALPEEILGFYKKHIEFITEHAVDPDRRRYSVAEEACRHYIDLDHYEVSYPVDTVPKHWKDAVKKYTEDTLRAYGIVPWHVNNMMYRLTEAFKEKDLNRVLRCSADIGHYIADANVPLHATENYNGQLTNQHGIHGFWESRLPELFSDDYDFFTGRAVYVQDVLQMAWQASSTSFAAKDSVLGFERQLNARFSPQKKYQFEQKGQTQIKTYSREYAFQFHQMLDGQVERRMRQSIWMVACLWYTAWVDAGQPDATKIIELNDNKQTTKEEQAEKKQEKMIGREEE